MLLLYVCNVYALRNLASQLQRWLPLLSSRLCNVEACTIHLHCGSLVFEMRPSQNSLLNRISARTYDVVRAGTTRERASPVAVAYLAYPCTVKLNVRLRMQGRPVDSTRRLATISDRRDLCFTVQVLALQVIHVRQIHTISRSIGQLKEARAKVAILASEGHRTSLALRRVLATTEACECGPTPGL